MYATSGYLLATLLALLLGPVVFFLFRDREGPFRFLDGFVMLAVPGLVFLHVVPESIAARNPWLTVALVAGLLAPGTLERITRDVAHRTDQLALVLGISGLGLHAILEGAAVSGLSGVGDVGLALAIVIHRIPVGLAVWWLVRDVYGERSALLAVLSVVALTLLGYAGGTPLIDMVGGAGVELYTAFVSGTLVHVAFHQIGHHGKSSPGRLGSGLEGTGAIVALGLFVLLGSLEPSGGHAASAVAMMDRFLVLAAESAPALLLAYAMAGALQAFLPSASIEWMSRGGSLGSAARGMGVGLPFPICSCGVVPLYETLVRKGAPASAAMAFLVATPELGLDAVMLSIPLLGGEFTVVRVVVAALAALLVGWLVGGRLERRTALPTLEVEGARPSLGERVRQGARSGFGEVVDHTAPWIVVGLIIAAVAAPLLEGGWLTRIPSGLDVVLFAVLGFPTYVCASSATPLVATLVATGLSPGAAIAFLITGPATNATTFGVVAGLHGRRAAVQFAGFLVAISIGAGLFINAVFGTFSGPTLEALVEEAPGPLQTVSLVLLGLLVLASILRRGIRRFIGELRLDLAGGHSGVKVVN